MTVRTRFARRFLLGLVLAIAVGSATDAAAQQLTRIRLTLEFRVYGGTAPTLYAEAGNHFRSAGIEAKIDGSSGSGEAVRRVASGTHDFGIADVGTLVEFNVRNPDASPRVVMMIFDTAAHAIISLKPAGINRPSDLAGKRLVTGQSDATVRIFPSLARLQKLDLSTVTMTPVDVRLRETMLLRHEADAALGFGYTVMFNLLGQKVPRDDISVVEFGDFGVEMYGNALIASRAMIDKNPALVRNVARAVARGWIAAIADPAAAIQALTKIEPLTDAALERQRLDYIVERHIRTAATRAKGLGAYDPEKLERSIKVIAEGFELPRQPAISEIYDDRFLPNLTDRRFKN